MITSTIRKRLYFKSITLDNGCILSTYASNGIGYRQIKINRVKYYVHRIAWELTNGQIPDGMLICHTCDIRNCINTNHMYLGTHKDNMQDCIKKGRFVYKVENLILFNREVV